MLSGPRARFEIELVSLVPLRFPLSNLGAGVVLAIVLPVALDAISYSISLGAHLVLRVFGCQSVSPRTLGWPTLHPGVGRPCEGNKMLRIHTGRRETEVVQIVGVPSVGLDECSPVRELDSDSVDPHVDSAISQRVLGALPKPAPARLFVDQRPEGFGVQKGTPSNSTVTSTAPGSRIRRRLPGGT